MTGVGEDEDSPPTLQDACTRHTSRQTDDRIDTTGEIDRQTDDRWRHGGDKDETRRIPPRGASETLCP